MDTHLTATPRTDSGKGAARKDRAAGKLPAVLYGTDRATTPVVVDPAHLQKIFRTTRNPNTVVQLELEDETVPVLVREVQRHPVSRDLLHVDFLEVGPDSPVEVMVEVETVGKPKGAIEGGRMRRIRRTLKVRAPYDKIPPVLTVDVSHMEIGDMITASQFDTPEGVEVVFEHDFNVVGCYGKRKALKLPDSVLPSSETEDEETVSVGGEAAEGEGAEGEDDAEAAE